MNSVLQSQQQQSSLTSSIGSLSQTYVNIASNNSSIINEYYQRVRFKQLTFNNGVSLDQWSPWAWLPIGVTAGLSVANSDNNALTPRDYILTSMDSVGEYDMLHTTNVTKTLDMHTTINQRFVSTALGINVHAESQNQVGGGTQQNGLPLGVNTPDVFSFARQTVSSQSTYGWFAQPTLNLHSRFFVSPGFRLDGGSASGTNAGLTFFPKLDFSYVAIDRPNDPLFGVLTLLRPRLAFGIAGVEPGPTQRYRLLQPGQVDPPSGAPVDVVSIYSLGNTTLRPERSRELEGGGDIDLWNQRLSLSLTGYRKMRYDAILEIPVAPSATGMIGSTIAQNIGTVLNTGFEANMTSVIVDTRPVRWDVNANLSRNNNRVQTLTPGNTSLFIAAGTGYVGRLQEGFPLSALWARPILGYYDANGDHVIEPSEIRLDDSLAYVGAGSAPNYQLAFSTNVTLFNGRVTVSNQGNYQNGLTQINTSRNAALALNSPDISLAQQAAYAAYLFSNVANGSAIGLIQTVNTLRWSNFSVSYVAPTAAARLFHASSLTVSLQGSNLALHTNYRGKDPDVNATPTGDQTQDSGQLPEPRMWRLRVTLGN
jgi:hypothetical protein